MPEDPGLNAIGDVPGTEGLIISAFAMIFGVPLTAWGTWRLFRVWQERHTELRLLCDGTQAEATIERLDVTPSNLPSCYIHYTYTDHLGQTHHAKTSGFYRGEVAGLMLGDKGSVRFNPERPGQSLWIEGAAIGHAPPTQAPGAGPAPYVAGAEPTAEARPREGQAPEMAEAATAPKKRGGPSRLFTGLLLLIAGASLVYFLIVPRWQAARDNLGGDPVALLAICIAGVILPVGYLMTLYGAISGGKPPRPTRGAVALAVAALFIVGGGGAIAYYSKVYGPSGKLEGLTAALPILSAFGALMFGFSLAGVAVLYLVVSAVSPQAISPCQSSRHPLRPVAALPRPGRGRGCEHWRPHRSDSGHSAKVTDRGSRGRSPYGRPAAASLGHPAYRGHGQLLPCFAPLQIDCTRSGPSRPSHSGGSRDDQGCSPTWLRREADAAHQLPEARVRAQAVNLWRVPFEPNHASVPLPERFLQPGHGPVFLSQHHEDRGDVIRANESLTRQLLHLVEQLRRFVSFPRQCAHHPPLHRDIDGLSSRSVALFASSLALAKSPFCA